MTFFEQIAGNDIPKPEEAEVRLDLSGMKKPDALEKLDVIVRYCKKTSAASLYVGFDPARPGEGETLFQPVARYFKFEKFNNYVRRVMPLMTPEDSKSGRAAQAGLFVWFKL